MGRWKNTALVVGIWGGHWRLVAFVGGMVVTELFYKPRIKRLDDKVALALDGVPFNDLELEPAIVEELKRMLPIWLKNDHYERVHWLNHTLKGMWPFIDAAVSKTLQAKVNALRAKLPKFLTVALESSTIGQIPPQVNGIKLTDTDDSEIIMDIDMAWYGGMNMSVKVKLFGLVPLPVFLRNFTFTTKFRLMIKDLNGNVLPCFNRVEFTFLEVPSVDCILNFLGVDLFSIPGMLNTVDSVILKGITNPKLPTGPVLWPGKFTKLLVPNERSIPGLNSMKSFLQGQLFIKLGKAKDLVAYDLSIFGSSSDPFVEVCTGTAADIYERSKSQRKIKDTPKDTSTTKENTLNPDWDGEQLTVCLPAELEKCVLMVRMWDKNDFLPYNNYMGSLYVPLIDLMEPDPDEKGALRVRLKPLSLELALTKEVPPLHNLAGDNPEGVAKPDEIAKRLRAWVPTDKDKNGRLSMQLVYSSFSSADLGSTDTNVLTRATDNRTGVLFVKLYSGSNLRKMDWFTGAADPMVYFTLGAVTKKSKKKRATLNPRWKQPEFIFHDVDPQLTRQLTVQVYDYERLAAPRYMGGLEIDVDTVIVTDKRLENFELKDAQGNVRLELWWRWSS